MAFAIMVLYQLFFLFITMGLALPVFGAVRDVQLSTGLYWSQGDYSGDRAISLGAIPLAIRIRSQPWSARLATTLLANDTLVENTTGTRQNERQSGLGDVWLSSTYHLAPRYANSLFIDIGGKLKWASGNETKGLGTGTTDVELRMDGFKRFDLITLNSGIGYRWRNGNSSYYEDSANGVVGMDFQWAAKISIGSSLSLAEASTTSSSMQREWLIYWSIKRPSNIRWTLYTLHGFSSASPDIGVGFTVSRTFDQR